jgi:CTP:molybdopterin cytidylyltransferase MocA
MKKKAQEKLAAKANPAPVVEASAPAATEEVAEVATTEVVAETAVEAPATETNSLHSIPPVKDSSMASFNPFFSRRSRTSLALMILSP